MDYLEIAKQAIQQSHTADAPPLDTAIKGLAIELWSDMLGERFWLVADEADAALLAEPRGIVYSASEARMLIRVTDPSIALEVIRYKAQFDGIVADFIKEEA